MTPNWLDRIRVHLAIKDFKSACRSLDKLAIKGVGANVAYSENGNSMAVYTSQPERVLAMNAFYDWMSSDEFDLKESEDDQ